MLPATNQKTIALEMGSWELCGTTRYFQEKYFLLQSFSIKYNKALNAFQNTLSWRILGDKATTFDIFR